MGGAVDYGEVWKVEQPIQDEAQDMEMEQATGGFEVTIT